MNMYTTWATSDTHYGHASVIKYSNRPFKNTEEMDEALIRNHNSVVKPTDTVIHLGDFAFSDAARIKEILRRLNGKYIFLPGNHDLQFWKDASLIDRFENAAQLREITKRIDGGMFNMSLELKYGVGGHIVLQHYAGLVWNKSHYGALMLHGHSHGELVYPQRMRIMDVGVDPQGYHPVLLADVIKRLEIIEPSKFANKHET